MFYNRGEVLSDQFDHFKLIWFWVPECSFCKKNFFIGIIIVRGRTEDIISYFTLMSSEIHYYDIIEKMGSWTLMSSEV